MESLRSYLVQWKHYLVVGRHDGNNVMRLTESLFSKYSTVLSVILLLRLCVCVCVY